MKKVTLISGAILLSFGTTCMAVEIDDLEIKLIDESDKSTLVQKGPIVGCNDHVDKSELTCSKKPQEIILSKLPTSSQLDSKDFDKEEDIEQIKKQLVVISKALAKLEKDRKKDQETISELNSMIKMLSDKQEKSAKERLSVVKSGIQKIVKKNITKRKSKYIPKEIKVVETHDDYIVIEVQNGESLSSYAEAYYGDKTKYYQIYQANRDKISPNLQVIIGDRITIPRTK